MPNNVTIDIFCRFPLKQSQSKTVELHNFEKGNQIDSKDVVQSHIWFGL